MSSQQQISPCASRHMLVGRLALKSLPTHRRVILCVDDDAADLTLRTAILHASGYDVLTASNGPDGLAILRTTRVDAVMLDYQMPVMNGEAVAITVREMKLRMPIVVISGHAACELPQRLFTLIDGYVAKGGSPGRWLSLLGEVLASVEGDREMCEVVGEARCFY